jgi:hypothetical protein
MIGSHIRKIASTGVRSLFIMAMARCAIVPTLFVVIGIGCQSNNACPGFCSEDQSTMFDLSCAPTDLTSVAVSGPCSTGDASSSNYASASSTFLAISSSSSGTCHVVLTFSTGFTYSADVTFVSQADTQPPGCHGCPSYIAPTQRTFMVDNPDATCIGAVHDAGLSAPQNVSAGDASDDTGAYD